MNKYELTITNNETKKSHRMSSMSYTTLIETLFKHSSDILDEITKTGPYTVYVPINDGTCVKTYTATYFPDLGNVCILHSIIDAPPEIHDGAFRELDFEEFDKDLPGRSWYYVPNATDMVNPSISPYKLSLRDKIVQADTYDVGAICFYKGSTAVITSVCSDMHKNTIYTVYSIDDGYQFYGIIAKELSPDKYNSIVKWEVNK